MRYFFGILFSDGTRKVHFEKSERRARFKRSLILKTSKMRVLEVSRIMPAHRSQPMFLAANLKIKPIKFQGVIK